MLQRSTNMAGYKHVGRDVNKPRPFQVKMWRNGKQARFVAPIHRAPRCDEVCAAATDSCISPAELHNSRTGSGYRPDELHPLTDAATWSQEHLGYFATPEEAALCYARASRALGLERLPAHQPCQASLQLQTDARPTPDPAARPASPPGPGSVEMPAATAPPPLKPPSTSQAGTLQNQLLRREEQFEWQEALLSRFPAFQAPSVQHEGLQPVSCMRHNDSGSVAGSMLPTAWPGSNRPWTPPSVTTTAAAAAATAAAAAATAAAAAAAYSAYSPRPLTYSA